MGQFYMLRRQSSSLVVSGTDQNSGRNCEVCGFHVLFTLTSTQILIDFGLGRCTPGGDETP
jgi:hypothetical protein